MEKKTGYDAVVFDMDGVIFDSERAVMQCWKELADKYDFEIVDTGINTSADIEIAASDLVSKVDCLCNLTDNTVVNALQTVLCLLYTSPSPRDA